MKKEIWVDVKNYENNYQISNFGNIRSKDRIILSRNKWGEFKKNVKGKNLKLNSTPNGYKMIEFYHMGKCTKACIHKLVYINFIGEIPQDYVIHHKDGNKINNHIDNLELLNYIEHNKLHSHVAWNKGVRTNKETQRKMILSRTITLLNRSEIMIKLRENGLSIGDIAHEFGCCTRTVYDTINKFDYFNEKIKELS